MSANCAGIVGGQLFQAKDGPKYRTGWTVIVCLLSLSIVFAIFNIVQYRVSNIRIDTGKDKRSRDALANGDSIEDVKKYHI